MDQRPSGIWKLITGDEKQYCDTGPFFPNRSTDFESQLIVRNCANGCLFNLLFDPREVPKRKGVPLSFESKLSFLKASSTF